MKKQVIMHVVDTLGEGGAQSLIYEYVKKMSVDYDMIVMTIYPTRTLNYERICKYAKVETVYGARNIFTRSFNLMFGKIYIPYRYRQIIRKNKPEILHLHLLSLGYIRKISNSLENAALYYTCHSAPYRMLEGERTSEGEAAQYLIDNKGLTMIALHEDMKRYIEDKFSCSNSVIINNGVDVDDIRNTIVDVCAFKRELDIPEDSFVVGHVGRFNEVKNHSFLIDVFADIAEKKSNAFLVLVGTGELLDVIRDKVDKFGLSEKVLFLTNRDDVYKLLKIMDVFVFPSLVEGLAISLLEAQAAGVRCLVSDSINSVNFLTEQTIPMSLDEPASKWAQAAFDVSMVNTEHGELDKYDIKNSVKALKLLYFGKEEN